MLPFEADLKARVRLQKDKPSQEPRNRGGGRHVSPNIFEIIEN